MNATLEQGTINILAAAINADKLREFFADPKNQADFEAWKKKRDEERGKA